MGGIFRKVIFSILEQKICLTGELQGKRLVTERFLKSFMFPHIRQCNHFPYGSEKKKKKAKRKKKQTTLNSDIFLVILSSYP